MGAELFRPSVHERGDGVPEHRFEIVQPIRPEAVYQLHEALLSEAWLRQRKKGDRGQVGLDPRGELGILGANYHVGHDIGPSPVADRPN
ncbi:hypothetical protein AB0C07_26355 [Actinoplanes missouriensis]|uniref:hypothetical protein n=1 Tax=Actinoplanes missouriensis TaxID=1866 RepID=UPI0033DB719C